MLMHSFRRYLSFIRRMSTMATFESLKFDNEALRTLPIDPEKENFTRQVPGCCFSLVKPAPVKNPEMVAYSKSAMELLDLGESELRRKEAAEYFSGNQLLPGSQTAAHCYCGHQFGYFSGQLGDGAAMYLGEVINKKGERWEIQLKGAGPTPYSRHSDGRKVLRSTIREFLCSEAIHHLGIGSTRAGTCVTSDTTVVRDIFYSGDPINEKCSIVLRMAPTFLRFGSFEIFKPLSPETGRKGPSVGNKELLIQMLDYAIKNFYKEIWDAHHADKETMYFEFWAEVVRRTARLAADWQCVGWCHGVLNTDNMSIMGITIDYGPFGFLDRYRGDFICNNSDDGGRYTYQKQPEICKWNCKKFAEAIQMALPLARTEPNLQRIYDEAFQERYKGTMRKKFGLKKELPEDKELVESFFKTMEDTGADFTNSFRCLSRLPFPSSPDFEAKLSELKEYLVSQCCTAEELKKAFRPRMDPRQLQMFIQLMETNPGILPALGSRFTMIAQELDRLEKLEALKDMTNSSKKEEDMKTWDAWLKMYTDRLRQEEGDTQTDIQTLASERVVTMNKTNPRVILRNYIAQHAIDRAEKGDYSEVRRVLRLLENPFSDVVDLSDIQPDKLQSSTSDEDADASGSGEASSGSKRCSKPAHADMVYDGKPPDWAVDLRVT